MRSSVSKGHLLCRIHKHRKPGPWRTLETLMKLPSTPYCTNGDFSICSAVETSLFQLNNSSILFLTEYFHLEKWFSQDQQLLMIRAALSTEDSPKALVLSFLAFFSTWDTTLLQLRFINYIISYQCLSWASFALHTVPCFQVLFCTWTKKHSYMCVVKWIFLLNEWMNAIHLMN